MESHECIDVGLVHSGLKQSATYKFIFQFIGLFERYKMRPALEAKDVNPFGFLVQGVTQLSDFIDERSSEDHSIGPSMGERKKVHQTLHCLDGLVLGPLWSIRALAKSALVRLS